MPATGGRDPAGGGREIRRLAAWNRAAPSQLIQLIRAGGGLSSDANYLINEVDDLVRGGGIESMATIRAIGEALLQTAAQSGRVPGRGRYLNAVLLDPTAASIDRQRVLIVDFDFFSTIGGGQTFYRRLIERHPGFDFFYPSAGPDIVLRARGQLPPNANPFAFNARPAIDYRWCDDQELLDSVDPFHAARLASALAAVQGMHFHVVDLPSFFPLAHVARVAMAAWGISADRVVAAMMGWLSDSVRTAYTYEADQNLVRSLERCETACSNAADARYVISELERANNARGVLPATTIAFENALETFAPPAPLPPGSGVPDLWYVGRLDGAKGADLFIELVATIPRHLYGGIFLTGPDNEWSRNEKWSQHVLDLAAARGIDVQYVGVLDNDELRSRVYRGRTVVVVPSRVDAFNFVALEAIMNGCPVLLSDRTGAHEFLTEKYPHLLPQSMSPDDMASAADALRSLIASYETVAQRCRTSLLTRPIPRPEAGFITGVYAAASRRSSESEQWIAARTLRACTELPLLTDMGAAWRPVRAARLWPRVSVVIPTLNRPHFLAPTLACLLRQTYPGVEVVVVDDGSDDGAQIRSVVEAFQPMARYFRTERRGEPGAANCAIEAAFGEYIAFLSDDDAFAPELLAESLRILDANPDAIGCFPDWNIVNSSGYFVEAHRLPEYDRRLMLCAHWCLPGPGSVIRRDAVRKVGGKDGRFRQVADFDLWLRVTRLGRMIRIPRTLAYWRLHPSSATLADQGVARATERVTLIEKFFSDPAENDWSTADRKRAFAAAHLAAAAITGRAHRDAAMQHLAKAAELDANLLMDLPPNMRGYPAVWPEGFAQEIGLPQVLSTP